MAVCLFLDVPWSCLRFVIVIFPDHTHLLFWCQITNSDAQSLEELNRSLEKVSMRKYNIWVFGYFNFPKFSWDSEQVPTIKPGFKYPSIYNSFISCLDDYSLVQMVSKPTRGDNNLDLFLTSNHTLVNNVEILSGISDHEFQYQR